MLAFGVWAAVAAVAVYWGLKLGARPLAVPTQAAVAGPSRAADADLARLFGAAPVAPAAETAPPPPESARFQLLGVVAPRGAGRGAGPGAGPGAEPGSAAAGGGVALIALDGKPPRAYRTGAVIDGDLVLQAVLSRGVSIGPRGGAALVSLELPPLPPPATGVPVAATGVPLPAGVPVPQGLPGPAALTMPPAVLPQPQVLPNPAGPAAARPAPPLSPAQRLRRQRSEAAAQAGALPAEGVPPQPAAPLHDPRPSLSQR